MRLALALTLLGVVSGCAFGTESVPLSPAWGSQSTPILVVRRDFPLQGSIEELRGAAERAFVPLGWHVRARGRHTLIRPNEDRAVVVLLSVHDTTLVVRGSVLPGARSGASAQLARILASIEALPGVGARTPAAQVATTPATPTPAAEAEGPLRPLRPHRSRH